MTRKTFTRLIEKTAAKKRSARDWAMSEAAKLGKPTSTGIASGTGLAAILAAAGAVARDGDPDPSILSNPLLLGALGATGGYLAGNAFERIPAKSDREHDWLRNLSLAGLTAGVGIPGTALAGEDIAKTLSAAKTRYDKATKGMAYTDDALGNRTFDASKKKLVGKGKSRALTSAEKLEFQAAGKEYAKALREAGETDKAIFHAKMFNTTPPPQADEKHLKIIRRALEKVRFSKYSPYRWAKAFNPMKGKALLGQLRGFATKNKALAGLAGGSLLLGSGGLAVKKLLDRD